MSNFLPGELDPLIHERVRLGILVLLSVHGTIDFTSLKESLKVTDGNLSQHLRKLEEGGYIRVRKTFVKRRPKTTYTLTPLGRKRLAKYLEQMEKFLREVKGYEGKQHE
jgi:DNA-binding HxlR family transcriptional regulator